MIISNYILLFTAIINRMVSASLTHSLIDALVAWYPWRWYSFVRFSPHSRSFASTFTRRGVMTIRLAALQSPIRQEMASCDLNAASKSKASMNPGDSLSSEGSSCSVSVSVADQCIEAIDAWRCVGEAGGTTEATFTLADGMSVKGRLVAADGRLERILVHDLETPLGTYPRAQLRTKDTACIDFEMSAEDARRFLPITTKTAP